MIRVGIGGWSFAPWKGLFYPDGLPTGRELEFASRALTSIELNATFYRSQGPASFKKWREETPENFVFAVKGHRAIANKTKLADAGEAIDWFFRSGVLELGEKLGPLNWQLAPLRPFDPVDVEGFLRLLPQEIGGRPIRHALEVRHQSFADPAFFELARKFGMAIAYADAEDWPAFSDLTADFVYARLQRAREDEPTGYPPAALDRWAERARAWAEGNVPNHWKRIGGRESGAMTPGERDVFIYMINGFKAHAPAAAMALIDRLGGVPATGSALR